MFNYDADVRKQYDEKMEEKSDDFKAGYLEGTLDSARGFYLSVKEIHDNASDKDIALKNVAQLMIAIGTILLQSGWLKEEEI